MRLLAIAGLLAATVALGACTRFGPIRPWSAHAARSDKPSAPLRAPPGRALLVMIHPIPQRSGDGPFTVFERSGPLAQFPEEQTGWTAVAVAPGAHHFYVRTWTSEGCVRMDANMAADKIYVLALNPDPERPSASLLPLVGWKEQPSGGALAYLPYLRTDGTAAARELASHTDEVEACVHQADARSLGPPNEVGFEVIDFAPRLAKGD